MHSLLGFLTILLYCTALYKTEIDVFSFIYYTIQNRYRCVLFYIALHYTKQISMCPPLYCITLYKTEIDVSSSHVHHRPTRTSSTNGWRWWVSLMGEGWEIQAQMADGGECSGWGVIWVRVGVIKHKWLTVVSGMGGECYGWGCLSLVKGKCGLEKG